jgi:periplasmic protein TonB
MSVPVLAYAQTPPPLLVRPPESVVAVPVKEISKVAVSYPTPPYPAEARHRHIAGKGLFYLHVSQRTGDVTSVEVVASTGHPILDNAAVYTLKRWKFRPHTIIDLKVPITFVLHQKT